MTKKLKIVVLTGAGISAESGLSTFRDAGGLWEGHDVMEVASIDGWRKNPELVLDFYNQRRAQAFHVVPNEGHLALVALEKDFDVHIITQNVDDLHERAGSVKILHLHGVLRQVRSSSNPEIIYDYEDRPIKIGDKCANGSQLRPHIVWFGEAVPAMEQAVAITSEADIFIIVGTSLAVYPAAGLLDYVKKGITRYIVDPNIPEVRAKTGTVFVTEKATTGVPKVVQMILEAHQK